MKLTSLNISEKVDKFLKNFISPNDHQLSYRERKKRYLKQKMKIDTKKNYVPVKHQIIPSHLLLKKLKEEAVLLASKVKVKGHGLSKGFTAIPNNFKLKVENLNLKYLKFNVEGPSKVKCNTISTPNSRDTKYAEFDYRVNIPGEYKFFVEYKQEPIPGSPFLVKISENKKFTRNSAQMVKVSGWGLEKSVEGLPGWFRVDLNRTGSKHGNLSVVLDREDEEESYDVEYIYWGNTCTIVYNCPREGRYNVRISYNGRQIPGSPFPMKCVQSNPGRWLSSAFKRLTTGKEEEIK